ncbi:hypothetical protein FIBSPDRAFT_963011 [Athelia psychrophila]|uniref:F-box domain-containing protein n=1 Tax=Athelia psychrophila TaxID=1759441 RepID=A0A165ZF43_9AGAM|nr:hypothetical protein FIBSPDRAFT_963011 [Fibularhizoctonia sp. CBS 109695]
MRKVLEVFAIKSTQWRNVHFRLPLPMLECMSSIKTRLPNLETLELALWDEDIPLTSIDLFAHAPRLHTFFAGANMTKSTRLSLAPHIQLLFGGAPVARSILALPWNLIRVIKVSCSDIGLQSAIDLVELAPNIESCELRLQLHGGEPMSAHAIVQLPKLRSLYVELKGKHSTPYALLRALCMPNICELSLVTDVVSWEPLIPPLVSICSQPSLQKLVLGINPRYDQRNVHPKLTGTDMVQILNAAQQLQVFEVRHFQPQFISNDFLETFAQLNPSGIPILSPKLREFRFRHSLDTDLDAFAQALQIRDSSGTQNILKIVAIFCRTSLEKSSLLGTLQTSAWWGPLRDMGIDLQFLPLTKSCFTSTTSTSVERVCAYQIAPAIVVALSTPRLWSSISLVLRPKHAKQHIALAGMWLARAGNSPLSIHLETQKSLRDPMRKVLEVFAFKSTRWRNIHFKLPSPMLECMSFIKTGLPNLEMLELALWDEDIPLTSIDLFAYAPRLQTFISGANVTKSRLALPWNQIRIIKVPYSHSDFQSAVDLLESAPNIESCELVMRVFNREPMPARAIMQLPKLRILYVELRGKHSTPYALLRALCMPNICELLLVTDDMSWEPLIPPLVSICSQASLQKLVLGIRPSYGQPNVHRLSGADVIQILNATQQLQVLEVRDVQPQFISSDFLEAFAQVSPSGTPVLCPKLREFRFRPLATGFDAFAQALHMRDSSGTQNILKSVDIVCRTPPEKSSVLGTLQTSAWWGPLRDMGIDLRVPPLTQPVEFLRLYVNLLRKRRALQAGQLDLHRQLGRSCVLAPQLVEVVVDQLAPEGEQQRRFQRRDACAERLPQLKQLLLLRPAQEEAETLLQRLRPPRLWLLVELLEPRPVPLLPLPPERPSAEPLVAKRAWSPRPLLPRRSLETRLEEHKPAEEVLRVLEVLEEEAEQEQLVEAEREGLGLIRRWAGRRWWGRARGGVLGVTWLLFASAVVVAVAERVGRVEEEHSLAIREQRALQVEFDADQFHGELAELRGLALHAQGKGPSTWRAQAHVDLRVLAEQVLLLEELLREQLHQQRLEDGPLERAAPRAYQVHVHVGAPPVLAIIDEAQPRTPKGRTPTSPAQQEQGAPEKEPPPAEDDRASPDDHYDELFWELGGPVEAPEPREETSEL